MKKDFLRGFLYGKLFPFVFKLCSKKPVKKDTAVFACDDSDELTDNMLPVYHEVIRRNMNAVVMTKAVLKSKGAAGQLKRLLFYIKFMKRYATAGYVFLTDYFFPVYSYPPRRQTRVIQLWHACGAFKRFGYSCADKSWGMSASLLERFPIHNTYTDVFVSAEQIASKYAEAFHCSIDIIRPMGTPRTDVYFDEGFVRDKYQELRERMPQIGDRKVILYAPTFRGDSKEDAHISDKLDVSLLKRELGGEYALLVKLHPAMKETLSFQEAGGFAFDITSSVKIEDALCAADIVITDYSSLIFEFALLNRPMIFYAYDLEQYEADRSFYYDYRQMVPGPVVRSSQEIVIEVKNSANGAYEQKRKEFLKKYMSSCDGHSTNRICGYLFGKEAGADEK